MDSLETDFTKMIKEHKSTIYTVCYMFSKDSQEVNDLFQEVLINLWKGFSKFEGKSSMKTWIWRVAFNTCISLGRKKKNAFDTVPLNMDIDLFDEKDAENKQIKLLHDRIRLLKPFD